MHTPIQRWAYPDRRRTAASVSARRRLGAAAGALGAAIGLALLIALVPVVVLAVAGPDAWWLTPFVLLALLASGGLLIALACEKNTEPADHGE
ncbi:MAG TPA: hypothetical protein VFD32_13105 [Dehalococcoidia bacterium]|nr:hypothetical protein [Dehalococcoidia bacterium]